MAEFYELKEKKDGSWEIWYPEEGWVHCTCDKCIKKTEAPLTKSFYTPASLEDAQAYLSGAKDVRINRYADRVNKKGEKDESEEDVKPSKSAKRSK